MSLLSISQQICKSQFDLIHVTHTHDDMRLAPLGVCLWPQVLLSQSSTPLVLCCPRQNTVSIVWYVFYLLCTCFSFFSLHFLTDAPQLDSELLLMGTFCISAPATVSGTRTRRNLSPRMSRELSPLWWDWGAAFKLLSSVDFHFCCCSTCLYNLQVGGCCFSELRAAYEVTNDKKNWEIIMGQQTHHLCHSPISSSPFII